MIFESFSVVVDSAEDIDGIEDIDDIVDDPSRFDVFDPLEVSRKGTETTSS